MRFGLLLPAGHHEVLRRHGRLAEEAGFGLLALGDSPLAFRELFTSLGVLAASTRRARLCTVVTNTVTRDVTVLASGIATVDELSGGRAALGLATGDSAVHLAGRRPATVAELATAIGRIRALLGEGGGPGPRVAWARGPVPVYVAAEGPRTLELAGQVADGAIVGTGLDEAQVEQALAHLAAGAARGGRTLDDLDVWFFARAAVHDDPAGAREELLPGLAASAHRAFRRGTRGRDVPEAMRPAVAALVRSYDVGGHLAPGGVNARLVEDLGLADFLERRFAVAGPVGACVERVRALEAAGVRQLLVSAAVADVPGLVERLGAVVQATATVAPAGGGAR